MTAIPWHERAACRTVTNPEIFLPPSPVSRDAITAATYCRSCPVLDNCVTDARAFGRLTGVVQGGSYWQDGHPKTIPNRLPTTGPSKAELAAERRRQAIARYYEIRHQHKTDTDAYQRIADEYGIALSTVHNWHAAIRKENAAKADAANRKAREAT